MLSSLIADFTGSLPYTISRRTIDEDFTEWHRRTPVGLVTSCKKTIHFANALHLERA